MNVKRCGAGLLLAIVLAPTVVLGVAAAMGTKRAVVLTGSMEPTYPVGSITFVEPYEPATDVLAVGDPIMFWSPADTTETVTHRIVEVRTDGLVTRGDANNVVDDWVVPHEAVLGTVRWHVPYLGYGTAWLQQGNAAMLALGGTAALFVLNEIAHIARAVRRRDATAVARPGPASIRPPDLDLRVLD